MEPKFHHYAPQHVQSDSNYRVLDLSETKITAFADVVAQAHGVEPHTLRLTGLQLGELPEAVETLTYLHMLDAFNCSLIRIDSAISRLTALKSLTIGCNDLTTFSAPMPPNLEYLNIERNQFTSIPANVCACDSLQWLRVSTNNLTIIPRDISHLTRLQLLTLKSNDIGALPAEIGYLQNLRSFDVSENRLTELPDEICQLTNLGMLALDTNMLTKLPSAIGNLSKLHELTLEYNNLRELPESICKCTRLRNFTINVNQLERLPENIGNMILLTELNLSYNHISELPQSVSQLTRLTLLDVSANRLKGEFPSVILNLSKLGYLVARHNEITSFPEDMSTMRSLEYIDVAYNHIVRVPNDWGYLPAMEYEIVLTGNHICEIPRSFANLTDLHGLCVGANPIRWIHNECAELFENTSNPHLRALCVARESSRVGDHMANGTYLGLLSEDIKRMVEYYLGWNEIG